MNGGVRGVSEVVVSWIDGALGVVAVLVVSWGGVRLLLPVLERYAPRVANYRGVPVPVGLGLVWLAWAVGGRVGTLSSSVWLSTADRLGDASESASGLMVGTPVVFLLFDVAPVALLVMALGLLDDVMGDPHAKGLRGHLGALRHGRLTTGSLKMLGIGLAAFLVAWNVPDPLVAPGIDRDVVRIAVVVVSTTLIAGTANLVNLLDLRPGRALKSYAVLVTIAGLGVAFSSRVFPVYASSSERFVVTLFGLIFALVPLIAVWGPELGERAMLGDAGANAFGFVAGYFLAVSLPLAATTVLAAAVVALNLLSERVSFSQVIVRNPLLHRLDMIGRLPADD